MLDKDVEYLLLTAVELRKALMISGSMLTERFFCLTMPAFLSSILYLTQAANSLSTVVWMTLQNHCFGNLSHSHSSGRYLRHSSCSAMNSLIFLMARVSY